MDVNKVIPENYGVVCYPQQIHIYKLRDEPQSTILDRCMWSISL